MGIHIVGAGAHGRVVADIFNTTGTNIEGFIDDNPALEGQVINGIPVIGSIELLLRQPAKGVKVIVALGRASLRLQLVAKLMEAGHDLVNAIHSSASISRHAELGKGICVCAGAVVNPNAAIGDAVIINTGATVDHDCVIGRGAHLSPGVHLAGRVRVDELCFLGTGVSVVPRKQIGASSIIGAGGVVVSDVPQGVLALGVPARVVRKLEEPYDWSVLL